VTARTLYLHDQLDSLRFAIRGPLDAALAQELLAAAATAESMRGGRPRVIDLREATAVDPAAAALLGRLDGAHTRFLTREQHLAPLANVLHKTAEPAPERERPLLIRWGCAMLQWLRPGCACSACLGGRVWSL
jgi:hypothetical protein